MSKFVGIENPTIFGWNVAATNTGVLEYYVKFDDKDLESAKNNLNKSFEELLDDETLVSEVFTVEMLNELCSKMSLDETTKDLFIKYAGQVYEQWGHHSAVIHATKKQNEELLEKMRSDYSSDYCETEEEDSD